MRSGEKFIHRPLLHMCLIVLLGLFAYSNTFHAPFTFDDRPNIIENPIITDVSNIPLLMEGKGGQWASRPLLNATLALNYHYGGFDTTGYHAVNVALHLLNGILLYLLVLMTGRHLGYEDRTVRMVAAISSALFILHPVQTEAVTNVVNRSALLAATFYFPGMIFFLKAMTGGRGRGLYLSGLLIVSLLGMASRENFATFPLMLVVYDLFFTSKFRLRECLGHYTAYLPVVLSLGYMAVLVTNNTYARADSLSGITPEQYVLTQFSVHWSYIKVFLAPIHLNLDYDYPIANSLFEPRTLMAALGYAGLWAGSLLVARRRPLAAFPVLWFLVTLLPISFGVAFLGLNLDDVMFEHRLYLPGAGLIVGAAILVYGASQRIGRKAAIAGLIVIVVFAGLTYARNGVWSSEVTLWDDTVAKSPGKPRPWNNRGYALMEAGETERAVEDFKKALSLDGGHYPDAHNNLGMAYAQLGRPQEALEHLRTAVQYSPALYMAWMNLANVYSSLERYDEAIRNYRTALELAPYSGMVLQNLGLAYRANGMTGEALEAFRSALSVKPDASVHNELGITYALLGDMDKAETHFRKSIALNGSMAKAHFNLALIYLNRGDSRRARAEAEAALAADPGYERARLLYEKLERTGAQ